MQTAAEHTLGMERRIGRLRSTLLAATLCAAAPAAFAGAFAEDIQAGGEEAFRASSYRIGDILLPAKRSLGGEKPARDRARAAWKSGTTPLGAVHAMASGMLAIGSPESPSAAYALRRLGLDGRVQEAGFDMPAAEADLAAFLIEAAQALESLEDPLGDLMRAIAREALAEGGYRRLAQAGSALHALSAQEEGEDAGSAPGARAAAIEALKGGEAPPLALGRVKEMVLSMVSDRAGGVARRLEQ